MRDQRLVFGFGCCVLRIISSFVARIEEGRSRIASLFRTIFSPQSSLLNLPSSIFMSKSVDRHDSSEANTKIKT